MPKRIPNKLLPHRDAVRVHPYLGGGADGRTYGEPVTLRRALIVAGDELIRDQYDTEVVSTATVYFERAELASIPTPETKFVLHQGTADERKTHVVRAAHWQHPRVTDLVEVKLR